MHLNSIQVSKITAYFMLLEFWIFLKLGKLCLLKNKFFQKKNHPIQAMKRKKCQKLKIAFLECPPCWVIYMVSKWGSQLQMEIAEIAICICNHRDGNPNKEKKRENLLSEFQWTL